MYGRSNAENMSIEEELWHVFTHYTLMSDPTTPAGLTAQQFLKLAKEVQLVVASKGLAEAQILVSAQVSSGEIFPRAGRRGMKLSFSDFVQVMSRLASRCHPNTDPAFAFQKILLENVLPLAQRRVVLPVDSMLAEADVDDLLRRQFCKGLDQIFDWYAKVADHTRRIAIDMTCQNVYASNRRPVNHHTGRIGYAEFLEFCATCRIFEGPGSKANALLSVRSVGDVYLASTRTRNAYSSGFAPPCVQDMTRGDFNEALLRLACRAYDGPAYRKLSAGSKLRALFLYLWRAMTAPISIGSICIDATSISIQADSSVVADFNAAFLKVWQQDGFVDYTTDETAIDEDGVVMLERIINRAADLTPAQFSRFVDDGAARAAIHAHLGRHVSSTPSSDVLSIHKARDELRISDIKRLLKNRQDIADLVNYQIIDCGFK